MHIASTTHEHAANAKVYTYEGEFEIDDGDIRWHADVKAADGEPRAFSGTIAMNSPAVATIAEQAVRDAIVKRIDSVDEGRGG